MTIMAGGRSRRLFRFGGAGTGPMGHAGGAARDFGRIRL